MTYAEAIEFLYSLRLFGTNFALENSIALARLNGNPHEKLQFIHVAGTNGKGSTCAMLESIYRAQGLRTGLFTSPHLVSFTERIQVNRGSIPEEEVPRLTERIIQSMGGRDPGSWPFHPTFFEFVTIMALLHFQQERTDLVIWETGLGGRLDATNIVLPLAAVITNIQYDHQQWLGSTLGLIAAEKAGIIKRGVPVITGTSEPEALDVISARARAADAPLTVVSGLAEVDLPLLGEHQRRNAAVALATVHVLQPRLPVSDRAIRRGLETLKWPGRLQKAQQGETEILLDGAHNPAGARTLAAALQRHFPGRPVTLILGLFADKCWEEICQVLVPSARRVLLVPLPSPRTVDVNEVRDYCAAQWPRVKVDTSGNVAAALASSAGEPFRVIAGSLHLVGEAMEALHLSAGAPSERALNEWDAAHRAG